MSISTDSSYARCAVVDNTTPYAWPWNGGLTGAATAVVVVSPAGGIPTLDKTVVDPAVKAAMVVADAVARSGGTVLHVVTQPSTQRPFAETSWIAEPPQHSALGWFPCLIPDDTIVAAGVDGFFDSSLESVLRRRRIERVIFVGVGLETSVHSTMRSANDRGYECLLVLDACVAYDQQMLAPAVSMIEMSGGIFGAVGYSPAFVAGFRSREKVFS